MSATIALASVVRKPKSSWSPVDRSALGSLTPRQGVHKPQTRRGVSPHSGRTKWESCGAWCQRIRRTILISHLFIKNEGVRRRIPVTLTDKRHIEININQQPKGMLIDK